MVRLSYYIIQNVSYSNIFVMYQGVSVTNLLTVIFVVFDWIIQLEQLNESLNIQGWTGFEKTTNVRQE